MIESLELCLKCDNSIFNKKHFFQNDDTAQGSHMSCSYSDIAIEQFGKKALEDNPPVIGWKRFRDDIFLVWPHSAKDLNLFFNYMNNTDRTKKIQFTMGVVEDVLKLLDLKLTFDKEYKRILVDIFAKGTNSFTYVLPRTYFPTKSIENDLKGVALRLRRICDSDDKFDERNVQYQKYLVARLYQPSKVKKQFSDVINISREKARRHKNNNNFPASCNLITQFNPLLPNIKTIIKKHLSVLHSSHEMLQIFLENTVNVTYRRNKNLKELISPSLFPRTIKENKCSIEKCNKRCDICKDFLVLSTEFTCHATKHKYERIDFLTFNTKKIIYLIACKCCDKQYIDSASGFKERFQIHKSDIITGKIRCGVASHLSYVCKFATCKTEHLQVQLIEHVFVREGEYADKFLWEREKYWQT